MTLALMLYTVLCTKTGSMTFPADAVWSRLKRTRRRQQFYWWTLIEYATPLAWMRVMRASRSLCLGRGAPCWMRVVHRPKGVCERVSRAHHPCTRICLPFADKPSSKLSRVIPVNTNGDEINIHTRWMWLMVIFGLSTFRLTKQNMNKNGTFFF